VLRGIDKVLEAASWLAAALVVLMLFIGPQVVAEDDPTTAGPQAPADGQTVFTDHCGSCHTLSAAGTNGQVGPNLDGVTLDAAAIEEIVRNGRGGMPALGSDLSDDEISAVASFVSGGG
jgi:mono/diheme cytochrome c family protein